MTTDELKARLLTDPDYIFSYMLGNNPAAITANLRGLGFTIASDADVFNAINALLENGQDEQLRAAFSVPMLTDQVDPAEMVVVQQASQALGNVNGMATKSASQDGGFDVGALFAGLATGALAYLNASGAGQVSQTSTTGTAQTGAAAAAAAEAKAKQQKTMWTIIGIAGAVLVVVLILVFRKKG